MLVTRGFGYVWLQQSVQNNSLFISQFCRRIDDLFLQENREQLFDLSEHRLYKHLTETNYSLDISRHLSEI